MQFGSGAGMYEIRAMSFLIQTHIAILGSELASNRIIFQPAFLASPAAQKGCTTRSTKALVGTCMKRSGRSLADTDSEVSPAKRKCSSGQKKGRRE
jgi:hypothetical protein